MCVEYVRAKAYTDKYTNSEANILGIGKPDPRKDAGTPYIGAKLRECKTIPNSNVTEVRSCDRTYSLRSNTYYVPAEGNLWTGTLLTLPECEQYCNDNQCDFFFLRSQDETCRAHRAAYFDDNYRDQTWCALLLLSFLCISAPFLLCFLEATDFLEPVA